MLTYWQRVILNKHVSRQQFFVVFSNSKNFLGIAGYHPTKDRPKLQAWLDKVKEEVNPYFDEGHRFIYKYADQYKGVPPIKSSL